MKFTLSQLKIGDPTTGAVMEVQADGSMIVGFRGDLIRVFNHSSRTFEKGNQIRLIVTGVNPYSFRLAEHQDHHLDVSI